MITEEILKSIKDASQSLGTTWPLYSFVTSNPLSGYENLPFEKALAEAGHILNAQTYPNASIYRQAWENGEIDEERLLGLLREHQLFEDPEYYLQKMDFADRLNSQSKSDYDKVDIIMSKWLSAFMDEGLAEWKMPKKEKGFYKAWKYLAKYDNIIKKSKVANLPDSSLEALEQVLQYNNIKNFTDLFKNHLSKLPGWVGYINHREQSNSIWHQKYPISILDYLAVRLIVTNQIYGSIKTQFSNENSSGNSIKHIWLQAWETSFQKGLMKNLKNGIAISNDQQLISKRPDAQFVFCIDTRSELIRRHVEAQGNYETFGYAGFFGIAMDYKHYQDDIVSKSCPPIVESAYRVQENPVDHRNNEVSNFKRTKKLFKSNNYILKRLKNMLPSSFGFVEGAGLFYGLSILAQTFLPISFFKLKRKMNPTHEEFCEPEIKYNKCGDQPGKDISIDEKTDIVKSGFELMGWQTFAPIVLFVGHGSHTTNNPFGSSLDCGACAASPGRHNARLLAKLANLSSVRQGLKEKHGIIIPEDTVFIGGEHNTTTDEILLFDTHVKGSHLDSLKTLKISLKKAQKTATKERFPQFKNSVSIAYKNATYWSETRPEWGLAKNASFIIAPRELTKNINLRGRSFLHSYDQNLDKNGNALEAIMCGPMVVTQWINNHYYFSTVDNDKFGSGSKITHNITGKFGVVQGNGGDLKMGLPLQSLRAADEIMYHQPLRLTVIINAPLRRVESILKKQDHLKSLLDNEWIYLKVMDVNNMFYHYNKNFEWVSEKSKMNHSLDIKKEVQIEQFAF